MKSLLLIWSLVLGQCIAGPGFFMNQQGLQNSAPVNTGKSPLEISVSCLQFLRAEKLRENGVADGAAVGASGSTVWEDEAGSNDATQSTVAARPTLIYDAYNGQACVRFDGGGDSLGHSGVASKACWAVLKVTAYVGSISYLCGSSGTGGMWVDIESGSPKYGPGWYGGGGSNRGANGSNRVASGGLHTVVWLENKIFIDGAEVTGYGFTASITGATITSLGISSHFVAYWGFDLLEMAHFNGTPTSTDIADLQAYAEHTYGAP